MEVLNEHSKVCRSSISAIWYGDSISPLMYLYHLEWKMMGERDYVLGIEPGNCFADGREAVKNQCKLKYISHDQEATFSVDFSFNENREDFVLSCEG